MSYLQLDERCYEEENPDAKGLANIMSLNECRKAYAEGKEFY